MEKRGEIDFAGFAQEVMVNVTKVCIKHAIFLFW